jgi:hypothetical protein
MTFSADLPVTPGAFDPTYSGGGGDIAAAGFILSLLPWKVLGYGLAGALDTPNLAGRGSLLPGSQTRLSVRGAKPNSLTWAAIGFSEFALPLLGGTLVPTPEIIVPFVTNALGKLDISFIWPTLAASTEVLFQFWSADSGAQQGWSATNALRAIAQ